MQIWKYGHESVLLDGFEISAAFSRVLLYMDWIASLGCLVEMDISFISAMWVVKTKGT